MKHPLANGKRVRIEVRCLFPSSVPTWEPLQTPKTPLASPLMWFLPDRTNYSQETEWPPPAPELCLYHDEKLTGLTLPFQGQPPQRPGPGDQMPAQRSCPPGAAHPFSAQVKAARRVLSAPRGIQGAACFVKLFPWRN